MTKEREPEAKWGFSEQEPRILKPWCTVRQTTKVWNGKEWKLLGDRYSEMPNKALQEEVEEYLRSGKQKTQNERLDKLKKRFAKNKAKQK